MIDTPEYSGRKSSESVVSVQASSSSTNDDRKALVDLHDDDSIDPVYQAKARVLNQAIHEIGMGRYQVCTYCSILCCTLCTYIAQWYLFVVTGFGWFA